MTHPRAAAARTPEKAAFIMAESAAVLTYRDLAARSAQAAHLFAEMGVPAGGTIAILVENQICFPELVWAAKDSGLRYVPISTHLNAADITYIVVDSGASLLVTSWAMREVAAEVASRLHAPTALLMLGGAEPPFASYEEALASQPEHPLPGRTRGSSMLYSSGTTGRPKAVRTGLADVQPEVPPGRFAMLIEQYGFDPDTVFLNPCPFYHAAPLRFMMTVQRCGGTVIGISRFDAAETLSAIERYRATHGFFVPTMFARMLRIDAGTRAAADLSSLRHAIHGAAPCPQETKRGMIDWWGPIIDELYAGTEAVGHTFITSREWLAHPGSVGRPAANCRMRVVDEAGDELPAGTPGRILMSNGLDVGYHGRAAATPLYGPDGFASLGDVGYLDAEGYLYLTDRESHMIIVGGVNIYPQEAEAVLASHPDIEDVAVIGIPHPDLGEEVKAVVQPFLPPGDPAGLEADILAYCRARLSAIKCPRSVDFVAALPRNEMGKLVKRTLRAGYWRSLGRTI